MLTTANIFSFLSFKAPITTFFSEYYFLFDNNSSLSPV